MEDFLLWPKTAAENSEYSPFLIAATVGLVLRYGAEVDSMYAVLGGYVIGGAYVYEFETQKNAPPPPGYVKYENTDYPSGDILPGYTGYSIASLEQKCSANPQCKGFNSNGWLKASLSKARPQPGTNFYIKQ